MIKQKGTRSHEEEKRYLRMRKYLPRGNRLSTLVPEKTRVLSVAHAYISAGNAGRDSKAWNLHVLKVLEGFSDCLRYAATPHSSPTTQGNGADRAAAGKRGLPSRVLSFGPAFLRQMDRRVSCFLSASWLPKWRRPVGSKCRVLFTCVVVMGWSDCLLVTWL